MLSDNELLQRYVRDGSERAFTELVQRHVHLVYYSALRRVGRNAHAADDVTQQVFTDLARKQKQLAEAMDQASSFFQALFFHFTSFAGSLVSLFIFSTAVAAEIRHGSIRITLTKPVSRTHYLLGKYLGGLEVMAGYTLVARPDDAIVLSTVQRLPHRGSGEALVPVMKPAEVIWRGDQEKGSRAVFPASAWRIRAKAADRSHHWMGDSWESRRRPIRGGS